ncbi:CatB-related O-acetyltransferase [Clostridium sp. DL1XJH146]
MFRFLLRPVVRHIKLTILNSKWRKLNSHNYTRANSLFTLEKVHIGKETYGLLNIVDYENLNEKLTIGCFCSIADNVTFMLGGEHHPQYISNYPFKMHIRDFDAEDDRTTKGPITIGDDVWIGYNCVILSGVTIGQGAVIAAGSIVCKDVPPYAIYTTNRVIKYRFSDEIIKKLLLFNYKDLEYPFVKDNIFLFYNTCTEHLVNELIKI